MDKVDVWQTGRLLPGADAKRAALAFARLTGLEPPKALALLTSGQPRRIKAGVPLETGKGYARKFAELGIAIALRPAAPQASAAPAPVAPAAAQKSSAAQGAQKAQTPDRVDVWQTGQLLPGADAKRAALAFARMANLEPPKALALLTSGQPRRIKAGVPLETGKGYVRKFAELGIAIALRPAASDAAQDASAGSGTQAEPWPAAPSPARPARAQADAQTATKAEKTARPGAPASAQAQGAPQSTPAEARPAMPDSADPAKVRPARPGAAKASGQGAIPPGTEPPRRQAAPPPADFDPEMPPMVTPTGIYAPQAIQAASHPPAQEEPPPAEGGWRDEPEFVDSALGLDWLAEARDLFGERTAVWTVAALLALFLPSAVLFLPFLGLIVLFHEFTQWAPSISAGLTVILLPVFVGGMMLMVQRQKNDDLVLARHILSGFWRNAGQQMLLGFLVLVYLALVTLAVGLIQHFLPNLMSGASGKVWAGVLFGGLSLPLLPACFLAPALVALADDNAFSAVGKSLRACFRNFGAFASCAFRLFPATVGAILWTSLGYWLGGNLLALLFFLLCLPLIALLFLLSFPVTRDLFYDDAL